MPEDFSGADQPEGEAGAAEGGTPSDGGAGDLPAGPDEAGRPGGVFRSTPLTQSIGTYLSAMAVVRLVNFGRLWLLTWFMALPELGLLTLILGMVNVLIPLCSLGLNDAVGRYVPQHEQRGTLARFMRRSLGLVAAVTAAGVVLIVLFAPAVGEVLYARSLGDGGIPGVPGVDAARLARASAVAAGLSVVYFYLLSVLKGLRMFGALSRMEMGHALCFLAGSGIAIVLGRPTAFVLVACYGVALALPVAWTGPRLFGLVRRWPAQAGEPAEDRWAGRLLRFSVWTTLSGVTWQALVVYSAWYLTKIHGHEPVGVFNTTQRIAQFILVAAVAVSTVVMTTVTKTWESEGREPAERQLSLAFRGTCFALFVACAGLALGRNLILALFRDDYGPGATILPLQLLFFLLAAQLSFLPGHFQLREKTRHMFLPWVLALAVNALLAFWLIGDRLPAIRASAIWRGAGTILSAVFTTGFSHPDGLDAAAWCAVLGIGAAVGFFVHLLRAEGVRLDRGTYVVIGSSLLLAARPWLLAAGCAVLMLTAWRTDLIFNDRDRQRIVAYLVGALRSAPPMRLLTRRRGDPE